MKKVLIIEDDMVLREATSDFLTEEGFTVFTAQDGMLGIKSAIKNLPDIILCDIELPSFNGYEVYSLLQENNDTHLIPFIFVTARAESEDIRAGMQKGVDDYITKPFNYDELLQSIKVRIEKRERLTRAATETYKILFDNSLTGVFIITGRRFMYANAQFSKILGYSTNELNKINWLNNINFEDKKRIWTKMKSLFLGIQKINNFEFQFITKNRKLLDLEISVGLTIYKGKSSLIGNLIEKRKEPKKDDFSLLENILPKDLDKMVEILEKKQTEISTHSIERIKQLSESFVSENKINTNIQLTNRELEVLKYFAQGLNKHEIGEKLFISVRTVERHRARLIEKTQTSSTVDLVLYGLKCRLIEL